MKYKYVALAKLRKLCKFKHAFDVKFNPKVKSDENYFNIPLRRKFEKKDQSYRRYLKYQK